tara:strand:- start:4493 stop:4783 length:291 start_codon:yes stop_codon:yes gene_type:complete
MAWTKEKMVEAVRIHQPHLGETEILEKLNRAKDLFCDSTGIYDKQEASFNTVANTTYYDMASTILRVESVWLNGVKIPRLIGKPAVDDPQTSTEGT